MIPRNTKKVISYLLKNLEIININQISKKLKISVGSAFKILKELEKDNVVLTKNLGNAKYYKLNLQNNETIKLCELVLLEEKRKLKGYMKIYADELKNFKDAELIILFGSILKKKEFNDVDVLFVTAKTKNVMEFCLEISKVRTKPISPLILKKQDLIQEIKNEKETILNIIKEGIVLKGEDKFIDVIKNARSQI